MIVLPAVFPARGGLVSAVLSFPLLLWLGLISYGIYLWHVPMISGIEDLHRFGFVPLLVLAAAATVAVAAASFYLLEAPLLRLKDPAARRAGSEVAAYNDRSS
jgi:peptidoglycan/LPS O-acetylase OafA/YrhL